jgi:hypothetical protein
MYGISWTFLLAEQLLQPVALPGGGVLHLLGDDRLLDVTAGHDRVDHLLERGHARRDREVEHFDPRIQRS